MSQKKSYIFLHNNDYETSYIDIYVDLLPINLNLLSVLQHYAYHQISDFEIYAPLTIICMIAKYIVISNTIGVVSDNILCICIQDPLLTLTKFTSSFLPIIAILMRVA